MKFPFISGVGSDGRRYDLPDDIGGAPSLVHVSFGSDTADAAAWHSLADELAGDGDADLGWYEVRVHQRSDDVDRPVADGGGRAARAAENDDSSRLTLHTDERGLRTALSLGESAGGCTLLLDGDEIRWETAGPVSDRAEAALRARLAD